MLYHIKTWNQSVQFLVTLCIGWYSFVQQSSLPKLRLSYNFSFFLARFQYLPWSWLRCKLINLVVRMIIPYEYNMVRRLLLLNTAIVRDRQSVWTGLNPVYSLVAWKNTDQVKTDRSWWHCETLTSWSVDRSEKMGKLWKFKKPDHIVVSQCFNEMRLEKVVWKMPYFIHLDSFPDFFSAETSKRYWVSGGQKSCETSWHRHHNC